MTKIRKVKRRKSYQYNVNRKRMNKKRLTPTESPAVISAWNPRTSSQKNFKKLGLAFDVNKDIKLMNRGSEPHAEGIEAKDSSTSAIINEIENNAKPMPKGKTFRFSEENVNYLTYLLDKYGDDYKAMSRDKKNYLQCTWKQIRQKIKLFKSIPDHYNTYLKNKKQL